MSLIRLVCHSVLWEYADNCGDHNNLKNRDLAFMGRLYF